MTAGVATAAQEDVLAHPGDAALPDVAEFGSFNFAENIDESIYGVILIPLITFVIVEE